MKKSDRQSVKNKVSKILYKKDSSEDINTFLSLKLWIYEFFEAFRHMFHNDEESDHDDHDHEHVINIKEKDNPIQTLSHHMNCVMEKHFNL